MTESILMVEDSDDKFVAVALVLSEYFGDSFPVRRAATVVEAEELTASGEWRLLVLDISMDIVASRVGRSQNGHASTGGMAVLERMYLLGKEVPTVIVTSFDAFRASATQRETDGILGIEDINRKAKQLLGDKYLGSIRYGAEGWQADLRAHLSGRL